MKVKKLNLIYSARRATIFIKQKFLSLQKSLKMAISMIIIHLKKLVKSK
jgi:hypothetical protein